MYNYSFQRYRKLRPFCIEEYRRSRHEYFSHRLIFFSRPFNSLTYCRHSYRPLKHFVIFAGIKKYKQKYRDGDECRYVTRNNVTTFVATYSSVAKPINLGSISPRRCLIFFLKLYRASLFTKLISGSFSDRGRRQVRLKFHVQIPPIVVVGSFWFYPAWNYAQKRACAHTF